MHLIFFFNKCSYTGWFLYIPPSMAIVIGERAILLTNVEMAADKRQADLSQITFTMYWTFAQSIIVTSCIRKLSSRIAMVFLKFVSSLEKNKNKRQKQKQKKEQNLAKLINLYFDFNFKAKIKFL